jgi:hypothetical protein
MVGAFHRLGAWATILGYRYDVLVWAMTRLTVCMSLCHTFFAMQDTIASKATEAERLNALAHQITACSAAISHSLAAMRSAASHTNDSASLRTCIDSATAAAKAAATNSQTFRAELGQLREELQAVQTEAEEAHRRGEVAAASACALHVKNLQGVTCGLEGAVAKADDAHAEHTAVARIKTQELASLQATFQGTRELQVLEVKAATLNLNLGLLHHEVDKARAAAAAEAAAASAAHLESQKHREGASAAEGRALSLHAASRTEESMSAMLECLRSQKAAEAMAAKAVQHTAKAANQERAAEEVSVHICAVEKQRALLVNHLAALKLLQDTVVQQLAAQVQSQFTGGTCVQLQQQAQHFSALTREVTWRRKAVATFPPIEVCLEEEWALQEAVSGFDAAAANAGASISVYSREELAMKAQLEDLETAGTQEGSINVPEGEYRPDMMSAEEVKGALHHIQKQLVDFKGTLMAAREGAATHEAQLAIAQRRRAALALQQGPIDTCVYWAQAHRQWLQRAAEGVHALEAEEELAGKLQVAAQVRRSLPAPSLPCALRERPPMTQWVANGNVKRSEHVPCLQSLQAKMAAATQRVGELTHRSQTKRTQVHMVRSALEATTTSSLTINDNASDVEALLLQLTQESLLDATDAQTVTESLPVLERDVAAAAAATAAAAASEGVAQQRQRQTLLMQGTENSAAALEAAEELARTASMRQRAREEVCTR